MSPVRATCFRGAKGLGTEGRRDVQAMRKQSLCPYVLPTGQPYKEALTGELAPLYPFFSHRLGAIDRRARGALQPGAKSAPGFRDPLAYALT